MTETTKNHSNIETSLNGANAPEIVVKSGASKSPVDGRELLRTDAGNVQATAVTMDRSGAETITAERVSMDKSGTRRLDAKSVQLENSGAVVLKSDNASLYKSSAVVVASNDLRFANSKAAFVMSGNTLVEGEMNTLFHLGPVSGNVRILLDGKRVFLLGAIIAAVFRLLGSFTRRSKTQ